MRTVWIVKETDLDISKAKAFGEIRVVYDRSVSPIDPKKQIEIIRRDVLPYSSPTDLIMTVGPTAMVSILSMLWFEYHGSVEFLIHSRAKQQYMPVSVTTI